jgi:hypothetical protein
MIYEGHDLNTTLFGIHGVVLFSSAYLRCPRHCTGRVIRKAYWESLTMLLHSVYREGDVFCSVLIRYFILALGIGGMQRMRVRVHSKRELKRWISSEGLLVWDVARGVDLTGDSVPKMIVSGSCRSKADCFDRVYTSEKIGCTGCMVRLQSEISRCGRHGPLCRVWLWWDWERV